MESAGKPGPGGQALRRAPEPGESKRCGERRNLGCPSAIESAGEEGAKRYGERRNFVPCTVELLALHAGADDGDVGDGLVLMCTAILRCDVIITLHAV